MKKKMMVSVVVAFVALLFAGPASTEPNFSEGMWEIKAELKLEGMPFPMPAMPVNYSQCITKKDLVPQKQEKNQECSKVSEKVEGNTVVWEMKCKDAKGAVTESTGKAAYAGTTFDAAMHMVTTDAKGGKSESRMTMKGRRTGECK